MSDKEQRRKNRQDKKARYEARKRRIIDPDNIVPLGIDPNTNLYDYLKEVMAQGKTTDLMLQQIDLPLYLSSVDDTLAYFRVPMETRSATGNFIIRFAILYSEQPTGKKFQVNANDPKMNYLMDLYEHFNRTFMRKVRS